MRFELAIVGLLLAVSATAAEQPFRWETFDLSRMLGGPMPYSIIKDILDKILENFEGEKKSFHEEIAIDDKNRFENVSVETFVPKIYLDLKDSGFAIQIKNLTAPIKLIQVRGRYTFEDLQLPGGFALYGSGEFTIKFEELNIFLLLNARHSTAADKWKVNDVAASASLKSCLIKFENLMNGEPMGDFIHKMVNEVIPFAVDLLEGLVQENKDQIMTIVSDILNKLMGKE